MSARAHDFDLKVEKHLLPNGLTVLLYEDHRLPQAAVNLWYHVGSKDEAPGKTGFAHLFEHMMFQGSEHYQEDFFKPLEEVGARLNGSTAEDRTNYWEVVPKAYLERALWLESDRMGFLLPAMDQAKLDNQREVVKNERRQTVENEPYGVAEEALLETLYPVGHPYHHSIIGSMADLDAATLEDVKDFFRRYYTPNNASLCVAGDIDPAEALALVTKYFAPIPAGPTVSPVRPEAPVLQRPVRLSVQDRVQLPRLHLQWPTAVQFTPDDAALSVLAYALATGKDSRLVKRLQVDAPLAQSVACYQGGGEVAGSLIIIGTAQPGRSLAELEGAVWEEIERLKRDGVDTAEVQAAKDAIRASVVRRLQSIGGFGGVADLLNRYQTFLGTPHFLPQDFARFEAVTPEAVREAARRFLDGSRYAMVAVVPRADLPAQPERAALPGPGAEGAFSLPAVARKTLANGLEVWACPQRGLPLVTASLVVRAGSSADPEHRPGLADVTADLLDESAAGLGPVELARRQKALATSLSTGVNGDQASFSLSLLSEHFRGGLGLLADVILRPDLRAEDLERLRQEHLSDLQRSLDDATDLGDWTLKARLYGERSPYGHPLEGTAASLKAMGLEEVRAFYRTRLRPDRALLLVVGDVDEAEAFGVAEEAFGGWRSLEGYPPPLSGDRPQPPGFFLVDKAGAPQSYITAGAPALSRNDPRYPAFMVFNAALGGNFTSRINMNLREDKGYTYGAQSYMSARLGLMPWIFYTSVQTDKTLESLQEARGELRAILGERPLESEEFEKARAGLVLRYPQNFETQAQLAQNLASLWVHGLPADFHERVMTALKALTLDETRRAGAQFLHPENLVWVVVGDRAELESRLAGAGLGPPVVAAPPGQE